jgi:uncharacterized protein (DUF58 family)
MLVAMFLYTYIFGDETSMLMLYMLIFSPVLSLILSFVSQKSLEISIDEKVHASQVEKDGVVGITVFFRNKSFIPIPIIDISFIVPQNLVPLDNPNPITSLGPYKTEIINLEYRAKYRGIAEIGVKDIKIRDFLGFFSFSVLKKHDKTEGTKEITVLNKISQLKMNSSFLLDAGRIANEETGTELSDFNFLNCLNGEPGYEFREYQPGDPLHKIHWKLSAKTDVFMVRKDEGRGIPRKKLILDPVVTRGEKPKTQSAVQREDKILDALISVVDMLVRAGRDVEVWLFEYGEWMNYLIKDRDQIAQMQHRLAAFKFIRSKEELNNERLPMSTIAMQDGNGRIFAGGDAMVFTALFDNQLSETIKGMQELKMTVDLVAIKYDGDNVKSEVWQEEKSKAAKMNLWTISLGDEISEVLV